MTKRKGDVSADVSGGTVQGVIGAQRVTVAHLEINNYVQPDAAPLRHEQEPKQTIPGNPYKGLLHFSPSDSALFFGRQVAVEKLSRAVSKNSFNTILGPSGSGKSSLVLAGIAPMLHAGGDWTFTYFRVSDSSASDPFLALAQALVPLYKPNLDATDRIIQSRKLGAALKSGELPISDVIDAIRNNQPNKRVLLIADQFEELFTANIKSLNLTRFVDLLLDAVHTSTEAPIKFSLLLTLRADFLGKASLHRPLADAIDQAVHILGPMNAEELKQSIVEPARLYGVEFDPGVVDTILADVGEEPGNLPLLEFALSKMWAEQRDKTLTLAAYDKVGRAKGALTNHADCIFEGLEKEKEQPAARRIFTQLVKVGSGTEDTRRVAQRKEIGDEDWPLAQKLAQPDSRLVVTNATQQTGETVEVAHEALITHWQTLRKWISEDRAFLTWLDGFRVFLEHGDLLHGSALTQAEMWRSNRGSDLSEEERKFITESIAERDRQATKKRERQARELQTARKLAFRQRIIATGSIIAAVVIAGMGWRINEARFDAEDARDKALVTQSRFLADLSQQMTEKGDAVAGMLLALRALPGSLPANIRPYVYEAERSLYFGLHQQRELAVLHGHEHYVVSAAFNHDGTRVVTASWDDTARLWNAADGSEIAVLRGHERNVSSAAFNHDGTRVVTTSEDDTARLWNAADGSEIAVLRGHESDVSSAAFNHDGSQVVTGSADGTARLWNAADGSEIAVLRGHERYVVSAAFNHNGSRVITGAQDNTARLWNAADGSEIAVLRGHERAVTSAAFNHDGSRVITASGDGTARLWSAADGSEIAVLRGHEGFVTSAAFNHDGTRVVTTSEDDTARLWNAADGSEIAVLRGHERNVSSAAFNHDGTRVVTTSEDDTARLWNAADGSEIAVLRGHESYVLSAAFNHDGSQVVTGSADGTARLWNAADGSEIASLRGHESYVLYAAFNHDGSRVVSGSLDETARLWNAADGSEIAVLRGHERAVTSAAFNHDGTRVVTGSADDTARLWNAADGSEIAVLRGHESDVSSAAFNHDGSRVVTGAQDDTARLWNAADGSEIAVLRGHEGYVVSAAFNHDGSRVITASWDGTARLWSAADGSEIAVLRGHERAVTSAAFNHVGSRVVTASWDDTARLWNAADGSEIAVLRGHERNVSSAAFNHDGTRVITASEDDTARLWNAADGSEIAVLRGHEHYVVSAAFNHDGTRVVTASWDDTARLWNAADGSEIAVLRGHERNVSSAAFNHDGTRVVVASGRRTVQLWNIFPNTRSLVSYVRNAVPRQLTNEQLKQFYLTD